MTEINQTFQSAPIRFNFKFNKKVEECSFIRSYTLSLGEKIITYKVVLTSPQMIKMFGSSLKLTLNPSGQFILPKMYNEEESKLVTKMVRALKAAAYFYGTARDFHPH